MELRLVKHKLFLYFVILSILVTTIVSGCTSFHSNEVPKSTHTSNSRAVITKTVRSISSQIGTFAISPMPTNNILKPTNKYLGKLAPIFDVGGGQCIYEDTGVIPNIRLSENDAFALLKDNLKIHQLEIEQKNDTSDDTFSCSVDAIVKGKNSNVYVQFITSNDEHACEIEVDGYPGFSTINGAQQLRDFVDNAYLLGNHNYAIFYDPFEFTIEDERNSIKLQVNQFVDWMKLEGII